MVRHIAASEHELSGLRVRRQDLESFLFIHSNHPLEAKFMLIQEPAFQYLLVHANTPSALQPRCLLTTLHWRLHKLSSTWQSLRVKSQNQTRKACGLSRQPPKWGGEGSREGWIYLKWSHLTGNTADKTGSSSKYGSVAFPVSPPCTPLPHRNREGESGLSPGGLPLLSADLTWSSPSQAASAALRVGGRNKSGASWKAVGSTAATSPRRMPGSWGAFSSGSQEAKAEAQRRKPPRRRVGSKDSQANGEVNWSGQASRRALPMWGQKRKAVSKATGPSATTRPSPVVGHRARRASCCCCCLELSLGGKWAEAHYRRRRAGSPNSGRSFLIGYLWRFYLHPSYHHHHHHTRRHRAWGSAGRCP